MTVNMTRTNEKIEVLTVTEQRRRRWSTQEKAELVRLTYEPGMSVSLVARQHCVAASQLFNWRKLDREGVIDPDSDALLAEAVRAEIAALPTYGYRRAGALANRTRSHIGLAAVNHKRYYRVMKQYGLLLPKAPKRRVSSRPHEGKVAVTEFNRRSCSDGFEIACDNGQVVTGTFTKDCCDREIIAWQAWSGRGLPKEPVREMLIEALEKRFGDVDGSLRYVGILE